MSAADDMRRAQEGQARGLSTRTPSGEQYYERLDDEEAARFIDPAWIKIKPARVPDTANPVHATTRARLE